MWSWRLSAFNRLGRTASRFTRGPMRGVKLMLLSSGLLQEIGRDGKLARLRCHRTGVRD